RGAALFFGRAGCTQCHTIDGTPAQATKGPNLTRVASRTSIAAGFLDNLDNDGLKIDPVRQRENIYNWISHSYDYKPGNLMWYPAGGLRDIVDANKKAGTPITDKDWGYIADYLMTLK
ncbi:MAG: c-type cytochrome, partial [Gammaproteobacteria bacterium]